MPTNNQEKWEEEFDNLFGKGIFIDGNILSVPDIGKIKVFLRQEIRQAKIEGLKLAQKIMVEGDDEIYEYINQEISNLKNNEQSR